jgi:hypothetical protein
MPSIDRDLREIEYEPATERELGKWRSSWDGSRHNVEGG